MFFGDIARLRGPHRDLATTILSEHDRFLLFPLFVFQIMKGDLFFHAADV